MWLFRVARFIDLSNLSEFFEKPILQEPPLSATASHISHIYFGRKNASKYFFEPAGTKGNRKLWDSLRSVSDYHRMLQGHQLTVEVLRQAYLDAQAKADDYNHSLSDLISTTALSYITLKHPEVSSDTILKGAKDNHPEVQQELNMACKL